MWSGMMSVLSRIADFYKNLPRRVQAIFYGADVALGSVLFHDKMGEEKTISLHLAEERDKGKPVGTIGCAVLDAADPKHCDRVKS